MTARADRRPSPAPAHDGGDYRLTEAGAAERFAGRHADDLRFDHQQGRWYHWCGHHWAPDVDGATTRAALHTVREWQREALDLSDIRERTARVGFALGLERHARLEAMLAVARCLTPLATGGRWDADPLLLGCPNGVVNLRTGALRPGRREDHITLRTAAPFDASATCARWERAMREWFPDPSLAEFVGRALGYTLTGITTEQCLFAAFNPGAGGKSTLLSTIAHALGDYAVETPFATFELAQRGSIPNDLAALQGKRLISASETNDGTRLNEARIKALTGNERITARYLHHEYFSFEPVGKIWLAFNHKPVVRDDTHAFWRRLRLIPFVNTFSPDPTLGRTLRDEAPGILAWLVRQCVAWQAQGLGAPAVVADATDQYRADEDHFGAFVAQACEPDPEAEVSAADLFAHYTRWADREGFAPAERLQRTAFGRRAGERFPRRHTRGGSVYLGVARGNV